MSDDNLFYRFPSGLRLEINSQVDFFLFQEFFCERSYDRAVDFALCGVESTRSQKKTYRIVDLGCNVGFFTTFAADKLISRGLKDFFIHGVDASRQNLDECFRRLRAQVVDTLVSKVALTYGAVGQKTGSTSFYEDPFHTMSHISHIGEPLDYVNLDTILSSEPIDLLKIDIEGAEEKFLQCYSELLSRTHHVLIEFHEALVDVPKCRERLANLGFARKLYEPKGNVSLEVFRRDI